MVSRNTRSSPVHSRSRQSRRWQDRKTGSLGLYLYRITSPFTIKAVHRTANHRTGSLGLYLYRKYLTASDSQLWMRRPGSMTVADTESSAWIRRYHPSGVSRARLVCFPHAGGSASYYHPVSERFSPAVDVIALQYPGRQDRRHETCIKDIGVLADKITEQLLCLSDKPTVLFGHSMGATLAFEVAWRLEHKGSYAHLRVIASGRSAPEIFRIALPAIRGDYQAIESYSCAPGRMLNCPITAITGDSDPRTTIAEAAAWRMHTTGHFRIKVFSGGHFYLSNHSSAVNAEIAADIDQIVH